MYKIEKTIEFTYNSVYFALGVAQLVPSTVFSMRLNPRTVLAGRTATRVAAGKYRKALPRSQGGIQKLRETKTTKTAIAGRRPTVLFF